MILVQDNLLTLQTLLQVLCSGLLNVLTALWTSNVLGEGVKADLVRVTPGPSFYSVFLAPGWGLVGAVLSQLGQSGYTLPAWASQAVLSLLRPDGLYSPCLAWLDLVEFTGHMATIMNITKHICFALLVNLFHNIKSFLRIGERLIAYFTCFGCIVPHRFITQTHHQLFHLTQPIFGLIFTFFNLFRFLF